MVICTYMYYNNIKKVKQYVLITSKTSEYALFQQLSREKLEKTKSPSIRWNILESVGDEKCFGWKQLKAFFVFLARKNSEDGKKDHNFSKLYSS